MAQNNRYIVCLVFSKQAIHRRGRKAHNTYSQKKSASDNHRGSDRPPGKINNPNRNAKFTPCFSRGEFGVFCHALKCTALTKGILPMELAQLSPENEYGITLVSLDEGFRKEMEPNTAPYRERIAALRALHDAGCKTWVSIEPYPTPNFIEQDLNKILDAISFCDKIIFGRLNYNKKVSEYKEHKAYFNELATQIIAYCEANGKQYHIKDGTIT